MQISNTKKSFNVSITLDLEEDYAGQLQNQFEALSVEKNTPFLTFLKKHKIPLTIFVQTKLLKSPQKAIVQEIKSVLGDELVSFHSHSHTHTFFEADSEFEIVKSKKAFTTFFGYKPRGYRAPEGRISLKGLLTLKNHGYNFDSSLFPSFLPKPRYLFSKNIYLRNPFIPEIAVSTCLFGLIPFSLSWIKLIGWSLFVFIFQFEIKSQKNYVFVLHLHDLWNINREKLPLFWKLLYTRNREEGFTFFIKYMFYIRSRGGSFVLLENLKQ